MGLHPDAFHSHAALLFPGQYLSAEAQTAFGQRFGEIEPVREKDKSFGISNRKEDGSVYKADDFRFKALRGNEGWHHDSTYMPVSAKAGLLSAIESRRPVEKQSYRYARGVRSADR